ncbi:MAG: adenylate/guanylate cyclase domain-containing protein [Magnetococcales bacterium]|nr:adenylate/guanylate cyclase domain-containing protein [Magnetococcales bacterium]
MIAMPWQVRFRFHLLSGVAVIFLSFYGRVVCPFIDSLSLTRIMVVLGIVSILQILIKELFYYRLPGFMAKGSPARQGYYVSIVSWLAAGVLASVLHGVLYPGFHWSSHLKLLTGYWGLGAGMLAQLEYVLLEQHVRNQLGVSTTSEKVTVRLMESFLLFTVTPVMMMVLMSFRFVYEGYTDRGAAIEVLFLGVSFVLAGMTVAWFYGRRLRKDCECLLEAVDSISSGQFQVAVDDSRPDELGRVALGVNEMAKGLAQRERIRDAFGRFVNPEVAASFLKAQDEGNGLVQLGGQRRYVAILMSDIRSFTPLSEKMQPEALTALLNGYFSEMVAAIRNHGGMVDKFIGDAIMAVFGLSDDRKDFPTDALAAALEMRERLVQFNQKRIEQGLDPIENGIGIHVGEVVAGYIGSADRLEFTVIGHAVNIAARIEGQAKSPNPPILFSAEMAERVRGRYSVHGLQDVQLKGVSGETALFTVADSHRMGQV